MGNLTHRIIELLDRGKRIRAKESRYSTLTGEYMGVSGSEFRVWLNDIKILSARLPENHPLKEEIDHIYKHKGMASTFDRMYAVLESLKNDDTLKGEAMVNRKHYDVFISHANKDKLDYVESLYQAIRKLGVDIFYDSEVLSWGDKWKQIILDGTAASEFAIIVISDNFFGREWTERELNEFLNRQNSSGQKIVLPLLHNITLEDLKLHYPELEELQVIDTKQYTKEEVAILFAKELIKRLKT